jgi:hypothetical protein
VNYEQKPVRAFGTIALLLDIPAETILDDDDVRKGCFVVQPDGTYNETRDKFVWMVFSGHMRHTHLDTNEVTERLAGYCSLGIYDKPGVTRVDVIENTKMMCIPPQLRNGIPLDDIAPWQLSMGESAVLPRGKKLFLASGTAQIGNVQITGPRQISVTSGDKNIAAVSAVYGLTFA